MAKTKAVPKKQVETPSPFEGINLTQIPIMGIDPAIAKMGYSLILDNQIIDCGVISTPSKTSISNRLLSLERDLITLLEGFEKKPQLIALERPHFALKMMIANEVNNAIGVILLTLAKAGYVLGKNVFTYYPSEVKLSVAGKGNADKSDVQDFVKRHFGLAEIIKPDDANDAVAIALTLQSGKIPGV